jgi:hypothetical protein
VFARAQMRDELVARTGLALFDQRPDVLGRRRRRARRVIIHGAAVCVARCGVLREGHCL